MCSSDLDLDAAHLGQGLGGLSANVRDKRGAEAKRGGLAEHAAAGDGLRFHGGDGSGNMQAGQG